MKKGFVFLLFIILSLSMFAGEESFKQIVLNDHKETVYEATMKRDLLCLIMAYPEYIVDINKEADKVFVKLKSGKKILYDDKKVKTLDEKMGNPDIQDVLEQIYPLTMIAKLMGKDIDPGRVRLYPMLKEAYGSTEQGVAKNLKTISSGGSYQFNGNNKAGEELKGAMQELSSLLKTKKSLSKFVYPTSGTFNYRVISGTNLLSPHAFGIAIDLARDPKDYWRWSSRELGQKRLDEYPSEIVEVFEKHNFVWGGKWSHFDILHYEYRPEIIMKARYFSKEIIEGELWYEGLSKDDGTVQGYIELIENKLKDETR